LTLEQQQQQQQNDLFFSEPKPITVIPDLELELGFFFGYLVRT
jgi:hypothetical protein